MMRRVAIELGSWRCGLNWGAAGPEVTRRAEALTAQSTTGGKSAALGHQKAVGGNTQGCHDDGSHARNDPRSG